MKSERVSSDFLSLSKELFIMIFKSELDTSPLDVNCTPTADKKRVLDQDMLRGIRRKLFFITLHQCYAIYLSVHAYYRYPEGLKYDSEKERERWDKTILKKLNELVRTARKKYRRAHNEHGTYTYNYTMIYMIVDLLSCRHGEMN